MKGGQRICPQIPGICHVEWLGDLCVPLKGRMRRKWIFLKRQIWAQYKAITYILIFWKWKVTVTFSSTTGNAPGVWEETGQPPQARGCCVQKVEIVDFCNYFPSETLWKHPYHWIHRNECQVSLGATSSVFSHIITLSTSIFSFLLIYIYFYSVFIYLTRCYWIPDNVPRSKSIKFKWIHPRFLWLT